MQDEIKVSVVIPMYNARDYITHCVDALLEQTLEDIEIIVIDDCSTDDGFVLCEDRYRENDRIVLLAQPENMGPGAARNLGIEKARGEYISFVDSDDALLKDAFFKMYEEAKKTDADVLHIGGALIPFDRNMGNDLSKVPENKRIRILLDGDPAKETRVLSKDIKQRVDSWLDHAYHWNIWSKLYRKDFLINNRIRFMDLSLAEDQNFAFACLIHAGSYVLMPGFFYIYRINAETLSRGRKNLSFFARLLRSAFSLSECMEQVMDGHEFFEENPEYAQRVKAFCLEFLENGFISDCYRALKREDMEKDEVIQEIFSERFGSNASYVAKLFYDAHDAIPVPREVAKDKNTFEFWEEIVEERGADAIIQV